MDCAQCLESLVIADPAKRMGDHIANQTQRLAKNRTVVTEGEDALKAIHDLKPQMLLLSLDISRPSSLEVIKRVRNVHPHLFIVGTYREMSLPMMDRFARAGVDDFLPSPVEITPLFRAASQFFGKAFRQFARHEVSLDVLRADGVAVGKTIDLSEGGMLMEALHPIPTNASVLMQLALPDAQEATPLRLRCEILESQGAAPGRVTARVMFQNLRGEDFMRLSRYLSNLGEPHAAAG